MRERCIGGSLPAPLSVLLSSHLIFSLISADVRYNARLRTCRKVSFAKWCGKHTICELPFSDDRTAESADWSENSGTRIRSETL
jgi:hypothetical protein